MRPKKYDDIIKERALEQFQQGKSAKELSKALNIGLTTLHNWKRTLNLNPSVPKEKSSQPSSPTIISLKLEIKNLKEENLKLKCYIVDWLLLHSYPPVRGIT